MPLVNLVVILYFNSIKVQLELATPKAPPTTAPFQFHKGTIRTRYSRAAKLLMAYFNSIKVQLEHL